MLPAIPAMAAIWDPFGKAEAAVIGGADPAKTVTAAGKTISGVRSSNEHAAVRPGVCPQAPGRRPARTGPPRTSRTARNHAPITAAGLVVKVVLLGLVAGIAIWAAFPLVDGRALDRAGGPGGRPPPPCSTCT